MDRYILRLSSGAFADITPINNNQFYISGSSNVTRATALTEEELKKFLKSSGDRTYKVINANTLQETDIKQFLPITIAPDPNTLPVIIDDKITRAIHRIVDDRINKLIEEGVI